MVLFFSILFALSLTVFDHLRLLLAQGFCQLLGWLSVRSSGITEEELFKVSYPFLPGQEHGHYHGFKDYGVGGAAACHDEAAAHAH